MICKREIDMFTFKGLCMGCNEVLLISDKFAAEEIKKYWPVIVLSAPKNIPPCPNGCQITCPDCNSHINLKIFNDNNEIVDFKDL